MPKVTVRRLYQENQKKLQLSWLAGTSGSDNLISLDDEKPLWSLVGHFNFIHPNKIQVIGLPEYDYLTKITEEEVSLILKELSKLDVASIIVANNLPVFPVLEEFCHQNKVPLMLSKVESPHLMDILRVYLQRLLALRIVKYGVFLDVYEVGVLITGDSGLGKSELALELISRGHSLVADDAVEIYKTGPEILEGRCPPLLRDFLEVRGLGVLNIRKMFGETAIRVKKQLKLNIHLVAVNDEYMKNIDRLNLMTEKLDVLNVPIQKMMLPVGAGRNIAVLVEVAVRNFILQARGLNSTEEFLDRHNSAMLGHLSDIDHF